MTKLATAFYSTAVGHKEMDGLYLATFGIPGEPALWVHDTDGKPKIFRSAGEAELAGFRVMMTRLNRARAVQSFEMKGYSRKGGIKVFRSAEKQEQHTVESVFGRKGSRLHNV